MPVCGAKTRAGGTCQQPAMPNGRCRMHGGTSLAGVASPSYKHGGRSRYLPTRLQANYHAALADPLLLELRSDVALLDARINDLLGRVDTGESGSLWARLQAARIDVLEARAAGDMAKQAEALNDLFQIISQGHSDMAAWRELQQVIDQRRRLVESERKRLIETEQMITSERAMLLLGAILGVIKSHVHDRDTLQAIAGGIQKLTTIEP